MCALATGSPLFMDLASPCRLTIPTDVSVYSSSLSLPLPMSALTPTLLGVPTQRSHPGQRYRRPEKEPWPWAQGNMNVSKIRPQLVAAGNLWQGCVLATNSTGKLTCASGHLALAITLIPLSFCSCYSLVLKSLSAPD